MRTNSNQDIMTSLQKIALHRSKPFCYSCYIPAPGNHCPKCHSDDLARLLPGEGVDFDLDFIIKHIINENLSPVDIEEAFEESIRSCYPEKISACWMELDAVDVAKTMDPISWEMARNEYIDFEESDGNLISFDNGSTYFWIHDVEEFIESEESSLETDESGE